MELWTAFLIGVMGSFHCVGMCGPIVLALPSRYNSRTAYLFGRVLYNFGRIATYSVLGLICGLLGRTVAIAGYQGILSIITGVIILLAVVVPGILGNRLLKVSILDRFFSRVKRFWALLFGIDSYLSLFTIGILNGFLPCGLVYIALAGAISTGRMMSGAAYMAIFGLGTMPILLVLSIAGNLINLSLRKTINRLIPIGAVILAALFILRGLSLGIPYISPRIVADAHGGHAIECSSHAEGEKSIQNDSEVESPGVLP